MQIDLQNKLKNNCLALGNPTIRRRFDQFEGVIKMYKNQERKLIWLNFIVAFIMGLSLLGRIVSN